VPVDEFSIVTYQSLCYWCSNCMYD